MTKAQIAINEELEKLKIKFPKLSKLELLQLVDIPKYKKDISRMRIDLFEIESRKK